VILGEDTVAETRAFNDELERRQRTLTPIETVPAAQTRAADRTGDGLFPAPVFVPQARWLDIPSRSGAVRLRVVAPKNAESVGAYLHIHGGGWVLGSADNQDPLLEAVAEHGGLTAVSVEYRLAPEHLYPAAHDDCEDAALWLVEHGAEELGTPARFAIGGESAGAHLSVTTLLRLRDRHGITGAFGGANLVYGAFDISGTPSSRGFGDRLLVLSTSSMEWFTDTYYDGRDPETLRDPDISPLFADLRDMPPALFTVGTADALLDDTLFMAARWEAAGNESDLRVYAEGCHVFNAFEIAIAEAANVGQIGFLRGAVT
jgi:acetyl esterase/lipase